jgi:hypothetical protein
MEKSPNKLHNPTGAGGPSKAEHPQDAHLFDSAESRDYDDGAGFDSPFHLEVNSMIRRTLNG